MTRDKEIELLFSELYPTGRAWNFVRNNNEKAVLGINNQVIFSGTTANPITGSDYGLILSQIPIDTHLYTRVSIPTSTWEELWTYFANLINTDGYFNASVDGDDIIITNGTLVISGISSGYVTSHGDISRTITEENTDEVFIKKSKGLIAVKQESYKTFYQKTFDVLNQLIPDNQGFNEDDVNNWERILGIDNSDLTLDQRKDIIYARMSYPNGNPYRLTAEYIQQQLQLNGFDLYVHENRFEDAGTFYPISPEPAVYGNVLYGETLYGNDGIYYDQLLSNYIDRDIDDANMPSLSENPAYVFFVGAETYPNKADVASNRLSGLRKLLLSLKPAHSIACLLIDANGISNGYLYNAFAYLNPDFAPSGWRVATDSDWTTLINAVGGSPNAGKYLKEEGLSYWNADSGLNYYNLSLRGSSFRYSGGNFGVIKNGGHYANNNSGAYQIIVVYNVDYTQNYSAFNNQGLSVRLVKEDSNDPGSITDLDGNIYETVKIGNQVWLKQNWACTKYNDGSPIIKITDNTIWAADTDGAYCSYNNDDSYALK